MSVPNSCKNIKKEDTLNYLENNITGHSIRVFSGFFSMLPSLNANTRKLKSVTPNILQETQEFNPRNTTYQSLLNPLQLSSILSKYEKFDQNEQRVIAIQTVLLKHNLLSTKKIENFKKYLKDKMNIISNQKNNEIEQLFTAILSGRNNIQELANKIHPNILQEIQEFNPTNTNYQNLLKSKKLSIILSNYQKLNEAEQREIAIQTVLLKHNLLSKKKIRNFKENIEMLYEFIFSYNEKKKENIILQKK